MTVLSDQIIVISKEAPMSSRKQTPVASIHVSGTGRITTIPDVAYLAIGIVTSGETASEASQANAAKGTAVKAALESVGVPARAIKTKRVALTPTYVYPQAKPGETAEPRRLVGYEAAATIDVTITDLPVLGKLFDAVARAGAVATDALEFAIQEREVHELAALTLAGKNARASAEAVAAGLGVSLGGLTNAAASVDGEHQFVRRRNYALAASLQYRQSEPPTTPVSPGELTVSAHVEATFTALA